MKYFGSAEEAAAGIVKAFENPTALPAPLATLFVRTGDDIPCRKWSWRNQLLVALAGHTDARGFRQWQGVGRFVKKGEKSLTILAPIIKNVKDEETGQDKEILIGFRGIPVFGIGQTDGAPLPPADPEAERWVESLPLVEVARKWGLRVEVFEGEGSGRHGFYRRKQLIGLGVKNLSTWAHELVHAADDRAGNLKEKGQHWRSETVAQLGAAVLLRLLGSEEDADLGGSWRYIAGYALSERLDVVSACCAVLERVCEAVRLILDTAEEIAAAGAAKDETQVPVNS
ncbi:hypothetical protein GobsT_18110 [Gemmata obscuriglobus]|uniref:N-terminal domain-containing protein n=1 Tax=Gemmata obscuriglobus TaxID=114 RepID=A0A2Z3H4M1_9BACT|nr:hypothetical protein [Gemmata obscuriglobus]AWM39821.1 hypothetical protein C1280_24310 [Gemmata obscuriglobus]QEG27058.1 hypothetical protein GobsT_18110 [Gemmata obscuriglobus]VTS03467.1 LtrC OS=sediment metagenome GN=LDC_1037 PE=4 SV=1 [Gemmata obscuriglobus UQM 2246]